MTIQLVHLHRLNEKIKQEVKNKYNRHWNYANICIKIRSCRFRNLKRQKKWLPFYVKLVLKLLKISGEILVGVLKNGDGPVVMLRTDMDALPVEEKTGFDFASTKTSKNTNGEEVPVMHACGHDIHMSVWTGAIRTLAALKNEWKGTLLVIAQQAEEFSGGAGAAIEAGLFQNFQGLIMPWHITLILSWNREQLDWLSGPVFAGVKTAEITVYGKGGHGAYPEKCIDPMVIASRIVLDLQTIVSREISPLEPVVVTVGSIHGGTRPNIIPDEVKMELTLAILF